MHSKVAAATLGLGLIAASAAVAAPPDLSGKWQVSSSALPGKSLTCRFAVGAPDPRFKNVYKLTGQCAGAGHRGFPITAGSVGWNGPKPSDGSSIDWVWGAGWTFHGHFGSANQVTGRVAPAPPPNTFTMTR